MSAKVEGDGAHADPVEVVQHFLMKAQLVGNSQDRQSRLIFCDVNGYYGGSATLRAHNSRRIE